MQAVRQFLISRFPAPALALTLRLLYSEVIEHLNRQKDNERNESQDGQTGNQQAQSGLTPLCASRPAWALREQILAMPRILQDVRGI